MLEEVDVNVGKDHLVKRSILLVKCWWFYENRLDGSNTLTKTLTEDALVVLVLALFASQYANINSPLQLLALFFATYSRFPWDRWAASISPPLCFLLSFSALVCGRVADSASP
jgi:hypothetical protein